MGRIMIIADPGEGCSATPRGLELAARLGLETEVIAFTYAPLKRLQVDGDERSKLRRLLLEEREKSVSERIEKYRGTDQKVKLKVVWEKEVGHWVTRRCTERAYTAVVKTGHRSESLTHTALDWQLFRECPAPVLIVAGRRWQRARPVLACLDLGTSIPSKRKLNHKVLAAAKGLAAALEVELEIIAAIEVPALLSDLDLVDPEAYARQAREEMEPHILELAAAHRVPESEFHCKRGPVERVISSRAARVGAQIVVLGTVGRKGMRARLLGNTAEQVLRHIKSDVLALKP